MSAQYEGEWDGDYDEDDNGPDDDVYEEENNWDTANVPGTGNIVLGDGNSISGNNNTLGHSNSFNNTTTNVTNNNNIVHQGGNGGNGGAGGNRGPGRRRAMVTIVGIGGGKRKFWQAPNGAIRVKGWQPNGTPWRTKTLVPAGLARAFTPLAAICWGGALGFKQIRLFYVNNAGNLQQMARIDGGEWQRTGLGFSVAAGSRLAVRREGGQTRLKFVSMQGGMCIAV